VTARPEGVGDHGTGRQPGPARPSSPGRWLERASKRALSRALAAVFRPAPPAPGALQPDRVRSLLVVRQHNQMGDMVCALPALHALRTAYPHAQLTFVTAPLCEELLRGHPDVDRLLVFRKQAMWRPRVLGQFVASLRRPRPDLAVVMTTVSFSTTSALLAWASGARVRAGGSSLPFGSHLSRAVYHIELPPGSEAVHEVEHNLVPLQALGIREAGRVPQLRATPAAVTQAQAFVARELPGNGPLVVAHVGAGKLPNIWPAEHFATVLRALQESRGARIVLSEGPTDARFVADVAARLGTVTRWRAPLGDTLGLLSLTQLVLSNDTGLAHVAAAAGVPTIVVFGPTDPERWSPPGTHVHVVRSPTGIVADSDPNVVLRAAYAALDGAPLRSV
jgi:ADP-heptose:LPS heptosyltransferase